MARNTESDHIHRCCPECKIDHIATKQLGANYCLTYFYDLGCYMRHDKRVHTKIVLSELVWAKLQGKVSTNGQLEVSNCFKPFWPPAFI